MSWSRLGPSRCCRNWFGSPDLKRYLPKWSDFCTACPSAVVTAASRLPACIGNGVQGFTVGRPHTPCCIFTNDSRPIVPDIYPVANVHCKEREGRWPHWPPHDSPVPGEGTSSPAMPSACVKGLCGKNPWGGMVDKAGSRPWLKWNPYFNSPVYSSVEPRILIWFVSSFLTMIY